MTETKESESEITLEAWMARNGDSDITKNQFPSLPNRLTVDVDNGYFNYEIPESYEDYREDVQRYPVAREVVREILESFDSNFEDFAIAGLHKKYSGEKIGIKSEKITGKL